MEGLDHGWKKSVKRYHFFGKGSFSSACGMVSYSIHYRKKIEFLTEIELTGELKVCNACYRLRKDEAIQEIKDAKVKGFWDNSKKCPECKTPVIFWNSNKDKAHTCTICEKVVMFQ